MNYAYAVDRGSGSGWVLPLIAMLLLPSMPFAAGVVVCTETYRGGIRDGECRELKIDLGKKEYRVERIDGDRIGFRVDISSIERGSVDEYLASISLERVGDVLTVSLDRQFAFCRMSRTVRTVGGERVSEFTELAGVCIHDLVIEVPRGRMETRISVEGGPIDLGPDPREGAGAGETVGTDGGRHRELMERFAKTRSSIGKKKIVAELFASRTTPLPFADLIVLLDGTTSVGGKNEILGSYLAGYGEDGRCLTIAQLAAILETYRWDSHRYAVVRKVKSRVLDPERAEILRSAFSEESMGNKAASLF